MKKKINMYQLTKNNYVAVFFFTLVALSSAYVIHHELEIRKPIDDLSTKAIESPSEVIEINHINTQIAELMKYINPLENKYTTYQSIFSDRRISIKDLTDSDMLYIAYKYIEKTVDFTPYIKEVSCDTFSKYYDNIDNLNHDNLDKQKCKINTYITKKNLKDAVWKIFKVRIFDFSSFSGTVCYFDNNEYICLDDAYYESKNASKLEFIKAYDREQYFDIIVKYQYMNHGVGYKDYSMKEVGEEYYKVTFENIDGEYYFDSAERYVLEN